MTAAKAIGSPSLGNKGNKLRGRIRDIARKTMFGWARTAFTGDPRIANVRWSPPR